MLLDHDVINLLRYLWERNVLNKEEKKTVEGWMTSEGKARCLIDTVMKKGKRESSLMVDYLTERHPDLCSALGLNPTSALIKLGRNRSKLVDQLSDLDVINLLRYLWEMNVLNVEEKKTVEGKKTSEDRARCLIDTVMKKGERESSVMVDFLTEKPPELWPTLGLTPTSALIKLGSIRSKLVNMLSDHDVIKLLRCLWEMNVFNDKQKKTVEEKTNREAKASCLIDTVMGKGATASSLMVDYLTEKHPELCLTLGLTPTSALIKLGRIRSKFVDMLSDNDFIDLLHNLRKLNVLNDEEKKTVEGKTTREDKARCLIDTVMGKGATASRLTVDYLTEGHPELCSTLDPTQISAQIKLGRIRSELIDWLLHRDVIGLLYYLRKMDVLNDQEMKTVEGMMTSKDRARCLIDTVMEKGERASRLMVDYLTERDPDLCRTLGLAPTSAWFKLGRMGSKLFCMFSDHDVINLLHYLREMNMLNDEEEKTVEGKTNREDKARCLIDTVMEKGESASSLMVDYLTERHPELRIGFGGDPSFSSGQERPGLMSPSLPLEMHEGDSKLGLVQNRSKPVKKKPSCSSGPGSLPGELPSSPPLKMPASDGMLDKVYETHSPGQDLSAVQLRDVAQTLGRRWERAALHLGLTNEDLDDIKKEEMAEFKQRRKMLLLWKSRRPGKATAQDLLRGLEGLKVLPVNTRRSLEGFGGNPSFSSGQENHPGPMSPSISLPKIPSHKPLMTSGSSGQGSLSKSELSGPVDSESSLPFAIPGSTQDKVYETRSPGQDLSAEQLQVVAKTLGKRWEKAALHLGLKNEVLEDIKKEKIAEFMQRRKMLRLWKEQRPGKATAQDLLSGLEGLKVLPAKTRRSLEGFGGNPSFSRGQESHPGPMSLSISLPKIPSHKPLMTSGSSGQGSLSKSELYGPVDSESSLPFAMPGSTQGQIKNTSAGLMTSGSSGEGSLSKSELSGPMDCGSPFPAEMPGSSHAGEKTKRKSCNRSPGKAKAKDPLRGMKGKEDLPVETHQLLKGLEQNRSKPVKKKLSFSSGQGSRPGELSPSLPLKKPDSDGTLDKVYETRSPGQDLSAEQLRVVAQTLGRRWERAALHLGLTDEDLDDIKKEDMAEFKQRRKMLLLWKSRRPGKATAQDLLSGLEGLKVLPANTRRSLEGLVQNRSKPVKKKLSFSSAQGSRPAGEKTKRKSCNRSPGKAKAKDPLCHGPVQNRSKPVKKKPSCSSGPGSLPGELSSSLPLKMPASDGMLGNISDQTVGKPRKSKRGELQRIHSEFVKTVKISVIRGLLDDLLQQKVLSTEDKDSVIEKGKIKTDMARCLIDMVIRKGEKASRIMIDSMKKRDPDLCSTLGLISSPAGVGQISDKTVVKPRTQNKGELQRIYSEFVKTVKISVIRGLLDDLLQQKVFSTEDKDSVKGKIKTDMARCLIDMVIRKGEKASRIMIDSMKKRDPDLCSTLGLISSPAGV
ncbi:unnamed protein product, partial [Arctogadus glacialis]